MALQRKYNVLGLAINAAGWTAVVVPGVETRRVVVYNPDVASDLYLSTDITGPGAIATIAAGESWVIELSSGHCPGFVFGETICYLKGAGTQPVISYAA